jgi:hypothetical protein
MSVFYPSFGHGLPTHRNLSQATHAVHVFIVYETILHCKRGSQQAEHMEWFAHHVAMRHWIGTQEQSKQTVVSIGAITSSLVFCFQGSAAVRRRIPSRPARR